VRVSGVATLVGLIGVMLLMSQRNRKKAEADR
jgi:hypothetical protein